VVVGVSLIAFTLNVTEEMVKIVVLTVMPRLGLVDVVVRLVALLPPSVVKVEESEASVTTEVSVVIVLDVLGVVIGVL
jgi:hypothetical protein